MNTAEIFTEALGLIDPWYVTKVEFKSQEGKSDKPELHINIDFKRGATFNLIDDKGNVVCDSNGIPIEYKAHDTVERTWRHLNFFQYETYLHARVPKIKSGDGSCPTVNVPWARKYSGFTLLFEAMVLELAKNMPVSVIANKMEVNDKRLWNIIKYYVEEAMKRVDMSKVETLGMDETSRKGHNYITVVVDLDTHNVLYVTEGKDSGTVEQFVIDFLEHKGNPDKIRIVTCDMSLGFKKGIDSNFVNSKTIIDKFHVIKHANEAVDNVRKKEAKTNSELKSTKYIWLKNDENLTENQRITKEKLSSKHLKTSRAYSMRVELQDIYDKCYDRVTAETRPEKLCSWMMHSRIEPMKDFCRTLKSHWDTILNYFENRFTNAILEGTNSIIQSIKIRARGFRNVDYFKYMIYLICAGFNMDEIIEITRNMA